MRATSGRVAAMLALLLVLAGGCTPARVDPTSRTEAQPTTPGQTTPPAGAAEPGAEPRGYSSDPGRFEFLDTRCGARTLASPLADADAEGRFCRVRVRVTHTSKARLPLRPASDLMYDDRGRVVPADLAAMRAVASPLVYGVTPGQTIEGDLVYDLPSGVQPSHFLHGWGGPEGPEYRLQALPGGKLPRVTKGRPLRLGDLTIAVNGVTCDGREPAGEIVPEGRFCRLRLRLSNTSRNVNWINPASQFLADQRGMLHPGSLDATTALNPGFDQRLSGRNATFDGSFAFDLPAGARPTKLRIADLGSGPSRDLLVQL